MILLKETEIVVPPLIGVSCLQFSTLDMQGCCGYCPYTFNNTVMQVLKITSLDTNLAIFDSSEAALEGIN